MKTVDSGIQRIASAGDPLGSNSNLMNSSKKSKIIQSLARVPGQEVNSPSDRGDESPILSKEKRSFGNTPSNMKSGKTPLILSNPSSMNLGRSLASASNLNGDMTKFGLLNPGSPQASPLIKKELVRKKKPHPFLTMKEVKVKLKAVAENPSKPNHS